MQFKQEGITLLFKQTFRMKIMDERIQKAQRELTELNHEIVAIDEVITNSRTTTRNRT
jgi:hypothetical protein